MLAAAEGALLLVEGKRDVLAVEALGLGTAVSMNQGKSLVQLADELGEQPVELLMDWDRTGDERQKRLLELLPNARGTIRQLLQDWSAMRYVEKIPAELAGLRRKSEAYK